VLVTCYIEIVPTDTVKYESDKLTGHLKIELGGAAGWWQEQTVEAVRGLSKRVAAVGGHLCVGPVHSGGFRVRVTVPAPAAQQV